MESLSKQELISTITKQAEQIKRYETRLRDVVTAYKGLVKEKEALEISLKALSNKSEEENDGESSTDQSVAALTESLATLTAEKSRMEEAFQADKKVTREKYENLIASLREESKNLMQQNQLEVNNLKAKLSYEIQEREKERADHAAMLKELNLKLHMEKMSKDKPDDKQTAPSESQVSRGELEKRVRDLSKELEAALRRVGRAESRERETPAALTRLQGKVHTLELGHGLAIREEQIKAKRAEETARKQLAKQEERVALLEGKLAELSQTIGQYDLRRRKDEKTIDTLKETLNRQLVERLQCKSDDGSEQQQQKKSETDNEKLADSEYLQTLIDKIHLLKKELISENEKLGCPIDIPSIFKIEGYEHLHYKCRTAYESLKNDFDDYKKNYKLNSAHGGRNSEAEINKLNNDIEILKTSLERYKVMLEQEKQNKADVIKNYEEKLKSERDFNKEVLSEQKTRIVSLEKQVSTQRDRYAALLAETDTLIRAGSQRERARKVSGLTQEDGHIFMADVSAPPHMLHYAHELARKDLDITQLRKEKHILEGHYRDCQRDATIEKERFKEVLKNLKEEIERLRRSQSREGANLEYLKNVVLAYIMSTNYAGRKHMLNAIAAVLHFTNNEKSMVMSTL